MVSQVGRADIQYLKGDATDPIVRPAAILHVCNDVGAWGAGFVMALSKRWVLPEQIYRQSRSLKLGDYQVANVEPNSIVVVNLIAQVGLRSKDNPRPLHYGYLSQALMAAIADFEPSWTIHMPRIGCGLAGGDWKVVEALIADCLVGFKVYVYDL